MKIFILLNTILRLGLKNIFLIMIYKFSKFTRFYLLTMPIKYLAIPYYSNSNRKELIIKSLWFKQSKQKYILLMNNLNKGINCWFNNYKKASQNPPIWFLDPYENKNYAYLNKHWSCMNDKNINDLKIIWELSRWNWSTIMARAWITTGNKQYLNTLNKWVKDWCIKNPTNYGFNWMCGQETSIRLINALITWKIINKNKENNDFSDLENFTILHLERITKTIIYAESQDNNHWISEASALFIGGIWLEKYSLSKKKGSFYANKGRGNLEKSVKKLIMRDGSFSQYSINYHRLLIDTLSQVELWREWLKASHFSNQFYLNCQLATTWLAKFVNIKTGQCPNIGGNDGAFCYQLHNLEYYNFKPSVQLSHIVFFRKYLFDEGPWDEPLFWLDIDKSKYSRKIYPKKLVEIMRDGGYGIIKNNSNFLAILKIPKYKFRPSQADPLHLDLWFDEINLLRDGGTYSYSKSSEYFKYFSGIRSHNTAQFDEQEPMKRISRFLWGSWLRSFNAEISTNNKTSKLKASYKFNRGLHAREIKYDETSSKVLVKDYLSNFTKKVIIRWRLSPDEWKIKGNCVKSKNFELSFSTNKNLNNISIKKGYESILYKKIVEIPVIEIEINESPCFLETLIKKN